jgi:hypothetical protein
MRETIFEITRSIIVKYEIHGKDTSGARDSLGVPMEPDGYPEIEILSATLPDGHGVILTEDEISDIEDMVL